MTKNKLDKDLAEVGFSIATTAKKNKIVGDLIDMINARHDLLDQLQKECSEELINKVQEATNTLVAYATAHKLPFDSKIVVDRINNIVTHTAQEHAMKTKKTVKKSTKTVDKREAERRTEERREEERREEERRQEAKPAKKAAKKTPAAPEKASNPAPAEPEPQKAASAPAQFKTPCGGLFDADPSSACFGMCNDESPEDFAVCMAHYKNALEQKTTKRRVAAQKTAEARVKREKDPNAPKKAPKRYDRIGDGYGTSAHMINILLLEGATLEEIMDIVPTEKTRVMGHLSGLKSGNGKRAPKVVLKDPTTKRYYLEFEEGEPCTYFTII
jgi:hypothetical protein